MKILFLPNWHVSHLTEDTAEIQAPDKYVLGQAYWFFKYFPEQTDVEIIDLRRKNILHRFEKKIKFYIWQGILAFFRRGKFDVVVSHGAQSGLVYSILCYLSPFKKNNPMHFIIDVGGFNGARVHCVETMLIRFALRSKPFVIYHSSVQGKMYEEYYKDVLEDTKFIRFGVNIDEFFPKEASGGKYVLSFGFEKRDYTTLLKAWKMIDSDLELIIIGDANNDGQKNVRVEPKVPISELRNYISGSLFVVVPLEYYNYSYGQMTILQSMAMAKAVVVTKTPSTIDYLEDGNGAFYVEYKNPDDMRAKIEYLLSNKDQLEGFGRDARMYVQQYLNERIMGELVFEYIQAKMK